MRGLYAPDSSAPLSKHLEFVDLVLIIVLSMRRCFAGMDASIGSLPCMHVLCVCVCVCVCVTCRS